MEKFANNIANHPRKSFAIVIVLTIFMGAGITKLETRNNYDADLPEDDSIVQTNDYLDEIFGDKDVVMIGLQTDNIYNKQTLQKIIDISQDIKGVQGVIEDEVTSLSTIYSFEGSDWGVETGAFMKEVPIDDKAIDQLKYKVKSNNLINGKIVSEDGSFTVIMANVSEARDQNIIYNQVSDIARKYEGPDKIYLAGGPIQQQEIDMGIQNDISFLLPLALLLVLIGYYVSFRKARGIVLPFLVVLLSVIWTMGIMGHLGFPVTVVSSALPMLMVAIASSYGIHILERYYEEITGKDKKQAVIETVRKIGPAILITGATSALGSATLLIFKVVSIKEFGIVTSLGILSTVIISLLLIPSLLGILKRSERNSRFESTPILEKALLNLANFSLKRKGVIVGITALFLVISVIGIMQLRVGMDFVKYFPKDHPLRISFNEFNEHLGGARVMEVMIEGKEQDAIKSPEMLKEIASFQEYAETLKGVGYTNSFADIVKKMNKEMNTNDPTEKVPGSRNLIAQFLLLYGASGDPGDFSNLVDYDYQRAKIQLMLTSSEQDDHMHIYQSLKKYANEHFGDQASISFGGEVMFWLAQIRYVVMGKIQNIILAIVVVLLVCMLIFRSVAGGLLSVVPLTISSLFTFGIMGLIGIRLEMSTAIITAIGIGIGVDFAIHYLSRFREEMKKSGDLNESVRVTMVTSGKAIIFDVTSNILGFAVFIFSGFLPIRFFGWLITLTMITVAFGSLVLFPVLFTTFRPRFIMSSVVLPADKQIDQEQPPMTEKVLESAENE